MTPKTKIKILKYLFILILFLFAPLILPSPTHAAGESCCPTGLYFSPITNRCEGKDYSFLTSLQKTCKDTEFFRNFATMNLDKAILDSCGKIDLALSTLSSSASLCSTSQGCDATVQKCVTQDSIPKNVTAARCPSGTSSNDSNPFAILATLLCGTGQSCIKDNALQTAYVHFSSIINFPKGCDIIRKNIVKRNSCDAPNTPFDLGNGTTVCVQLANNMWEFNSKLTPCTGSNNIKGIQTAIGCVPTDDLTAFLSFILKWVFGLAGGIILLMVISTGYTLLTSSGNPEKLQAVKENLVSIFSGLIMIGFSLVLLQVIGANILGLPTF